MIKTIGKNITVKKDANTSDIISALLAAVPAATKNIEPLANSIKSTNPREIIKHVVNYMRKYVSYQKDGYQNQDIKFPGRLVKDKRGDCKSFALFLASALTAKGVKNGLRFVSYRPGDPTHVYNYYYNAKGVKIPIDTCIADLKETNHLKQIDMDVNYLAAPEIGKGAVKRFFKKQRENREERQEIRRENREETKGMTRKEKRAYKKEGRGEKRRPVKRAVLAPARTAFLELVKFNFRDLANKFEKTEAKEAGSTKAFWNRLGGDYNKLKKAIELGKTRRPFLGEAYEFNRTAITPERRIVRAYVPQYKRGYVRPKYMGAAPPAPPIDPATLTALIGSAAAILKPLMNLFKSKGLKDKDTEALENSEEVQSAESLGKDFEVTDPEPGTEKASSGKAGSDGGGDTGSFLKNPLVLVAAAAAAVMAFKK